MECQEQGLQQQNKKNEQYEHLLRKYRERFPDADKNQSIKKFNSLRTNFRKELKRIKDSERKWYWSRRRTIAKVMVFWRNEVSHRSGGTVYVAKYHSDRGRRRTVAENFENHLVHLVSDLLINFHGCTHFFFSTTPSICASSSSSSPFWSIQPVLWPNN